MANPVATARGTPAGLLLRDGYGTKITFASNPTVAFWEHTSGVGAPAVDGGDPVEITTMFNTLWKTKVPSILLDLMPFDVNVLWDPRAYSQIQNMVNRRGDTCTVTFPDGSTLAFFGYLRSFAPGQLTQGAPPQATINIVPTNWDEVNDIEAGPVLVDVTGT